jgi:hypothetical protein
LLRTSSSRRLFDADELDAWYKWKVNPISELVKARGMKARKSEEKDRLKGIGTAASNCQAGQDGFAG